MNGGEEYERGDAEGRPAPAQVPIGWQRNADRTGVVYMSPSGSLLSCLAQVKSYLLTDGTCKCGLECPLILPKVFNFDPRAAVRQRTAEDAKADEDVTKLCIHKRKLIAVATLHKSMELPRPSLTLTSPGGGTSATSMAPARSSTPRAIRNKSHEGLPNSVLLDGKNPFRMLMGAGQRHYPPELSAGQHQELYAGYPRPQLGSGEPGPRSPYRGGHGGMLSPASYGDGSPSPRADPLGSPDAFAPRGSFQGAGSPGPVGRMPLSPPGMLVHGSPVGHPACALAGRTNAPLSPAVATKSPVMKKPLCNVIVNFAPGMEVPRAVFHHRAPPTPHPAPPSAMSLACALQKKRIASEKDPLGILDPIPSKQVGPLMNPNPSNFQPGLHSQVPLMNVNIPPAVVPLPSNLPLPTAKPAPVGHGGHMQRTPQAAVSPSPVTSPAHMTGLGRVEASPQRSRSSSTSSDHGSFAMPSGPQGPCGGMKVPPRSPRSSMGSPRPAMPSSPSAKPDALHQYKDLPAQLLAGIGGAVGGQHSNPMFPPAAGAGGPPKGHPGLLGMPLNQLLNQHNAASFPASSLLSAAAKAQLANQTKLSGNGTGMGSGGGGSGHPCPVGSAGGRGVDGHSTLNPMLPPSSAVLMPAGGEAQSGRAALRDKLMAQQRDPLRKRKQPPGGGGGANHDGLVFNALMPDAGAARLPGPPEQPRKAPRLAGLPPNASMAQLLQSMSCQSSHTARSGRAACSMPGQMHFAEGGAMPPGPAEQRLHGPPEGIRRSSVDTGDQAPPMQYPGMMNPIQASPMVNCGPMGPGGPVALANPSMGHPGAHPQQLSRLHQHPQGHALVHGRAGVSVMVPNSNDGSCAQAISEPGDCGMGNPQMGGLYQQHSQPTLHQALQGMLGHPVYQGPLPHPYPENPFPDNASSNSMACLYQSFQGCMPESLSAPHAQMSAPPGMTSLPEESGMRPLPQYREGRSEALAPGAERLPGGGPESVDAIYRAVVDAASKGMHVVIAAAASGSTRASPVGALSAMSAFTASVGEPVVAVVRGQREAESLPGSARVRPMRAGRPRGSSERGASPPEGGGCADTRKYFRLPAAGTPQGEAPAGGGGPPPWRGDDFLECSTQVRSGPGVERHGGPPPGDKLFLDDGGAGFRFGGCATRAPANFKERLEQTVERCAHVNGGGLALPGRGGYGGDVLGPPRQELTGDEQSPSSSTSLEGSLAKEYGHYNGHYNGHCAPSPSDTKSLSSEEDLRHPDSPSAELLHYRPRGFHVGELVWGPIKGFPAWPGKLAGEEQAVHNASMQLAEQAKVEPEKLKTLTQDLEALNRATKRNRKAGKLNNHLEAAIHEAMSELDKMSATVHQIPSRERQVKLPKPKRRKISR